MIELSHQDRDHLNKFLKEERQYMFFTNIIPYQSDWIMRMNDDGDWQAKGIKQWSRYQLKLSSMSWEVIESKKNTTANKLEFEVSVTTTNTNKSTWDWAVTSNAGLELGKFSASLGISYNTGFESSYSESKTEKYTLPLLPNTSIYVYQLAITYEKIQYWEEIRGYKWNMFESKVWGKPNNWSDTPEVVTIRTKHYIYAKSPISV